MWHHILTTEAGNEVRNNEGGRVNLVEAAVEQCINTLKTSFSELKAIINNMFKRPQINSSDQFLLKFFPNKRAKSSVIKIYMFSAASTRKISWVNVKTIIADFNAISSCHGFISVTISLYHITVNHENKYATRYCPPCGRS
jgi:hypothetical protein